MSSARVVLSALLVVSQLSASAQNRVGSPDASTGLIVGTVVDAVTGKPIEGVLVLLDASEPSATIGPPPLRQGVLTGADGRFLFARLARGRYFARTEKSGYVAGGVGTTRPGMSAAPIELPPAEAKTDLVIRLWRSSTISGVVLDEMGEPAIGVDVTVERREVQDGHLLFRMVDVGATTDDRGVYRLTGLEPGDYLAYVSVHQATMPTSVLEGFYKDSIAGNDMSRWLLPGLAETPGSSSARQAGKYVVQTRGPAATPSTASGAPKFVYASTFYPGVPALADAKVIHVAAGTEHLDVNFQLRPAATMRMTGTLRGPDGPLGLTRISLIAEGSSTRWQDFEVAETTTEASGAFTLLNVPEGQYTLAVLRVPHRSLDDFLDEAMLTGQTIPGALARVGPQPASDLDEPVLWAQVHITAGSDDISDLIVTARPGLRLCGRIEFVGTGAPPGDAQLAKITPRLSGIDGRSTATNDAMRVKSDGTLTARGYPPGRYFVTVTDAPSGWTLASAMHGGIDVSQVPLDLSIDDINDLVITFTDERTELSGVLKDETGHGDASGAVVVFPADALIDVTEPLNPRRVRRARASENGAYSLRGLPPGDYFVAGLVADDGRWTDPGFLQTLATQASRVRIEYGRPATAAVVTRKTP